MFYTVAYIAFNCVHCGVFYFKNHCVWCVCVIYLVQKTAWQLVNRKADFFTKRIDSHNESNRFESRIGMLYLPPFLPVPVTVDLRGSSWVRRCRKPRTCSAGPGWPVLGFVEPTPTTIYGQVSAWWLLYADVQRGMPSAVSWRLCCCTQPTVKAHLPTYGARGSLTHLL